jgi:hypothetical protein
VDVDHSGRAKGPRGIESGPTSPESQGHAVIVDRSRSLKTLESLQDRCRSTTTCTDGHFAGSMSTAMITLCCEAVHSTDLIITMFESIRYTYIYMYITVTIDTCKLISRSFKGEHIHVVMHCIYTYTCSDLL